MIYIGADHGGFSLKKHLKQYLTRKGYEVNDEGNTKLEPLDDYVDFAVKVAENIKKNPETDRGILICRNGVGVCIAANKIAKIRCGLGFNPEMVKYSSLHDNINILSLPADYVSEKEAEEMVEAYLTTDFSREVKYQRRLDKISDLEK